MRQTKSVSKEQGHEERKWHVVDAAGVPVGRLASEVAALLRGKHKPTFTPHQDCGDFVLVVNASKVVLTGTKPETKLYRRHTGYFGGLKETKASDMLATKSDVVIETAVWGMLPKGPLGRRLLTKCKIFKGPDHDHAAQQPQVYKLKGLHTRAE